MPFTTADVLALPDGPQKQGLLARLRPVANAAQPRPVGSGDVLAWSAVLSLVTVSEPNTRGHHMATAKRAKAQRAAVRELMRRSVLAMPPLPAVITLTRIGCRPLDSDNLGTALKHVQDEVSATYGVDDGAGERDGRYTWVRAQRPGPSLAVEVRIERVVAVAPRAARRRTRKTSVGSKVGQSDQTQQAGRQAD